MWIMPPGVSFIAAVGGPGRADPCPGDRVLGIPARARIREMVRALVPQRKARSAGPSRRSTRLVRTSATTFAGVACGHDFGLELRSSRPSHPWVRYRLIQRWAQVREMPISLATWATGRPLRTRSPRIRLPAGVRRALRENVYRSVTYSRCNQRPDSIQLVGVGLRVLDDVIPGSPVAYLLQLVEPCAR
jgi:hypothetical protein